MLKLIIPTCGGKCLGETMIGMFVMLPARVAADVEYIIVYNEETNDEDILGFHDRIHRCFYGNAFHGEPWPGACVLAFPERIGYARAVDWGYRLAEPESGDIVGVMTDDMIIEGDSTLR